MTTLLRKPFGTHGKVHEITPQSAGWRHGRADLFIAVKGTTILIPGYQRPREPLCEDGTKLMQERLMSR